MKKPVLVILFSIFSLGFFASGLLRYQAHSIKQLRQIPINRCGISQYEMYLDSINPQRAAERIDTLADTLRDLPIPAEAPVPDPLHLPTPGVDPSIDRAVE